jgi:hypothetical protein
MRKKNIMALMIAFVLSMALPCSVSYASSATTDSFATNQLQGYIGGYSGDYQNFGFASQSDMENARLGTPVHLYRFEQTGVENYVYGNDLPLVDNQEWLYPIYGGNNQIENVIRISVGSDGTQNSIFGGFTADFLKNFFQKNNDLTKQADNNSLKVIFEENLSALFFEYKLNGKSLTIPYRFSPNGNDSFQDKTVYDTSSVGQELKARQVKYETELNELHKKYPNELLAGGGGIGVSPLRPNGHQESLFSLWVLMVLGVVSWVVYLTRGTRLME